MKKQPAHPLTKEIARHLHHESPHQTSQRHKIMEYLNQQLKDLEEIGEVVTIVTFNRNDKKLCCYGHWIKDDILFAKFHPSIGVTAISHPHFYQLQSWRIGRLVPLQGFGFSGIAGEDRWVALINIPVGELEFAKVLAFPRWKNQDRKK